MKKKYVDKNDIVHVVYADYNNDPAALVYAKNLLFLGFLKFLIDMETLVLLLIT